MNGTGETKKKEGGWSSSEMLGGLFPGVGVGERKVVVLLPLLLFKQ